MIALVPFMYSIFQHEMRILIEGKKSTFKAEKRPRALRQEKPSEEAPGMGLSYMYNPTGKSNSSFQSKARSSCSSHKRSRDRGRRVGTSPMGAYTWERSGANDFARAGIGWRRSCAQDIADVVQAPESVFLFEIVLGGRSGRHGDGQLGRLIDVILTTHRGVLGDYERRCVRRVKRSSALPAPW